MAQTVEKTAKISAAPERVLEVLADFESYPDWQASIVSAEVKARDSQGRPTQVALGTAAMGMTVNALLDVTHGDGTLSYSLNEPGELLTQQDVNYVATANAAGGTDLRLTMVLDVKLKLPDFMVKQLVTKGVNDNIKGAKKIAEKS